MRESVDIDLMHIRQDFLAAHHSAIQAVGGRACVAAWLRTNSCSATYLVAIGKAAAAMTAGALDILGPQLDRLLVITKSGHLADLDRSDPRLNWIESSHPVADERSLAAGRMLQGFIERAPGDARFLLCISGGASALVEDLYEGLDAAFLRRMNAWLLASGLPIDVMNRIRKRASKIKAGRVAERLLGRETTCLMISDVPGDDLKTIGSGLAIEHQPADIDVRGLALPQWLTAAVSGTPALAAPEYFESILPVLVARPEDARIAAAKVLQSQGYQVRVHGGLLQGDALVAGGRLVAEARGQTAVVHIHSSETTVVLPEIPGRGGRCQALTLAAALQIDPQENLLVLAAGTDGTDGPGDAAGAVVDCGSVARGRAQGLDPHACLEAADSGRFLSASDDLLYTGPTGTNVMDLIISISA